MKSLLFVLCLLLCAPSLVARHAPLPRKLINAKTAYIDNRTGLENADDRAYDELKKWGRFRIVEDPRSADVILLVTARRYVSGSYTSGTVSDSGQVSANTYSQTSGATYLTVVDPQTGAALWSDGKRWGSLFTGFRSATRSLIKELRKRIDAQEKSNGEPK